MSGKRALDATWEAPLPHALTSTRTYLSAPSAASAVAIIALHGRGDSARDFADSFVPHLQSFFGPHLAGELDASTHHATSSTSQGRVQVTLRALEALDGVWFGTHNPRSEVELDVQAAYVHGSLCKLHDEIRTLNAMGIASSRIVLVGFSQGAILVNTYLLRALSLLSNPTSPAHVHDGQLLDAQLPVPACILAWAGSTFNFETQFPTPAWPTLPTLPTSPPPPPSSSTKGTDLTVGDSAELRAGYRVWSHQQCGASDRYFSAAEIAAVAHRIAHAGQQAATHCPGLVVSASAHMEPGNHALLPGMTAKLIQMVHHLASS